MPKGVDRKSSGRPNAPVVDISPPVETEMSSKFLETLVIDPIPTTEGIKYTITNIGGMSTYIIVLSHRDSGNVYCLKALTREGYVPVPSLAKLRGKWDTVLLVDFDVAYKGEAELELTLEWLAEAVGKVNICFGTTDGPLDRLGAVILNPYPKKHCVPNTTDEVAFCISLPELPDNIPPSAKMVVQVLRPGNKEPYFQDVTDVMKYVGYKLKIDKYAPCAEPGDWTVRAQIGTKVIGTGAISIICTQGGLGQVTETSNPVEEFHARVVG